MLSQDQWATILTLAGRSVDKKVIACKLGLDVWTVLRYLRQGGRIGSRWLSPVHESKPFRLRDLK